jgi:hypothetical protein
MSLNSSPLIYKFIVYGEDCDFSEEEILIMGMNRMMTDNNVVVSCIRKDSIVVLNEEYNLVLYFIKNENYQSLKIGQKILLVNEEYSDNCKIITLEFY